MTKEQLKNELSSIEKIQRLIENIGENIYENLNCNDNLFDTLDLLQNGEINADEAYAEIINDKEYEFTEPKYIVKKN